MMPHNCKKPFLCSCEVPGLADRVSDKLIGVVKKELEEPTPEQWEKFLKHHLSETDINFKPNLYNTINEKSNNQ